MNLVKAHRARIRYKKVNKKNVPIELKKQIIADIDDGIFSAREIPEKTSIPASKIRHWLAKARNGKRMCSTGGRQRLISKEHVVSAANDIFALVANRRGLLKNGDLEFWLERAQETANDAGFAYYGSISHSSLRKYRPEVNLVYKIAEQEQTPG